MRLPLPSLESVEKLMQAMGIGGQSSTSVAGSPGPENVVWATARQGFLLLPFWTWVAHEQWYLGLQSRSTGLARQKNCCLSRFKSRQSRQRDQSGAWDPGENGPPGICVALVPAPSSPPVSRGPAFPTGRSGEGEWKIRWTLSSNTFCSDFRAIFLCA